MLTTLCKSGCSNHTQTMRPHIDVKKKQVGNLFPFVCVYLLVETWRLKGLKQACKLAPNTQRVSIKNAPHVMNFTCVTLWKWRKLPPVLMMKQLSLVLLALNKQQFTSLFMLGSLSDICRASTAGIYNSTFKCSKSSVKKLIHGHIYSTFF